MDGRLLSSKLSSLLFETLSSHSPPNNFTLLHFPSTMFRLPLIWTAVHQILLERLEASCGIKGLVLLWITSYLSERTQPLSRVTLGHPRFQPSWASLKALSLVLYNLFSIQLTFRLFSQSNWLLDISSPMMSRPMSMVLLLLNYNLPPKLMLFLMNFTSGCLPTDSH